MEQQRRPVTHAMFHGEQGTTINIHDGNFTQHIQQHIENGHVKTDDGFERLQNHVATTAFDSVQEVDVPKCHPNTRLAVLAEIMDWILLQAMRTQWILWLNGAAGAGKSAIARSITALCLAKKIPVAGFFFSRIDPTRNSIQLIVATLVYQLFQQLPGLSDIIIPKIESDPLIFTKSLETQLESLLFTPLRQLHHESPLNIVVLLLDGIDECINHASQTALVRSIANFICNQHLPIIVFFASRAENQLQQIFRSPKISTNLLQSALDTHYLPDTDIRVFLDDSFELIRETHLFNHHLGANWPDLEHIQEIVQKSSGQFIYASAVIKFVSSPHRHPALQLEIVRGLRPAGNLTPFAQLDTLYRHIFSQVDDIDRTSFILAWAIFGVDGLYPKVQSFFGMHVDNVRVLLAELASVVVYEDGGVHFLHLSLPDFLLDQARSQEYYLDKKTWCTRLSIHCFRRISAGLSISLVPLIDNFLPYSEGTAELRKHVLALDFSRSYKDNYHIPIEYLTVIQTLDFGDGGEVYRNQLDRITRYILFDYVPYPAYNCKGAAVAELQKHHDISEILVQIESEKGAELVLQRTDRLERGTTPPDILHTSHGISENEMAAGSSMEETDIIRFHNETGVVTSDAEVDITARQILKRSREYIPIPSNKSLTETGSSDQERGRAKRKKIHRSSVA